MRAEADGEEMEDASLDGAPTDTHDSYQHILWHMSSRANQVTPIGSHTAKDLNIGGSLAEERKGRNEKGRRMGLGIKHENYRHSFCPHMKQQKNKTIKRKM